MKESTPPAPQAPKGIWFFPYREMQLADGGIYLKLLKPVLVMNARQTAEFTGLSTKTLARLAESGFIRVRFPTPRIPQYYPGEVMEFIARTEEDPDFWTEKRRRQYGLARRRKK